MADTFKVERSTIIVAPPAAAQALVNDFHRWTEWSPWEGVAGDALERSYSGAEQGVGAVYSWSGKKTGDGRMEIVSSTPDLTSIKLDFFKPFEAHNTADFSFTPVEGGTQVVWAMTGPKTLMSRVMGLFFSMDKMVGGQFAQGLANLKRVVEAKPAA